MKQLVLGIFLLIGHYSLNAQVFLFETESSNSSDMTNVQSDRISESQAKTNVDHVNSVNVINDIFHASEVSFKVDNNVTVVHRLKENIRSENNYSWFGETVGGDGVFFYVNNGKIASKFNLGESSYTLIPLSDGSHVLVKFNSTDVGECATTELNKPQTSTTSGNNNLLSNSECTLRVLIATTPSSRSEIISSGFDIPTFAQLAVDEANMAYVSSKLISPWNWQP